MSEGYRIRAGETGRPAVLQALRAGNVAAAAAIHVGPDPDPGDIEVQTVTTAAVGVMASAVFALDRGFRLDLKQDPPLVLPDESLAKGTVEILWGDDRVERRSGLTQDQLGYVLRAALATTFR